MRDQANLPQIRPAFGITSTATDPMLNSGIPHYWWDGTVLYLTTAAGVNIPQLGMAGGELFNARAKTPGALPAVTYANGALGVGATLTANANGAIPAQDGVTLVLNDVLLVDSQVAGLQNGLYTVTQVGTGALPFILTRLVGFDTLATMIRGSLVVVQTGTAWGGSVFEMTATLVAVGTTAVTFAEPTDIVTLSGAQTIVGQKTFSAGIVAGTIGPVVAQQHTLPAVASDTVALLAAVQALTNKTITAPILGGTVTGTYSLGGTPTLAVALAVAGAPNIGSVAARAGTVYAATFDASTSIFTTLIGPSAQHTIPAVAADTFMLRANPDTISGQKTFLDLSLRVMNAAGTFAHILHSGATAARDATLPDGTTTLAGLAISELWTGTQTFGHQLIRVNNAAATFYAQLGSLATANRNINFPDLAGTVAVAATLPATLDATTGTIGVSLGTTGTTAAAGNDARLNPAPAVAGRTLYDTGVAWAIVAPGTATQVLHGAAGSPTWGAVVLTTDVSGVLPIANGGTNSAAALANNRVMVSSAGAITELGAGTTTTVLHGNAAGAPTYGAVVLTTDVSGILPFANGGTGSATRTINTTNGISGGGDLSADRTIAPSVIADTSAGAVTAAAFGCPIVISLTIPDAASATYDFTGLPFQVRIIDVVLTAQGANGANANTMQLQTAAGAANITNVLSMNNSNAGDITRPTNLSNATLAAAATLRVNAVKLGGVASAKIAITCIRV